MHLCYAPKSRVPLPESGGRGRGTQEGTVEPDDEDFSGFVFKLQANMDPKHRDRVAFLRICSGTFERGMK
eukprot:564902-Prorocentrum_minimum.AAC.1